MEKSVLLLNNSEEILNIIPWEDAVRLLFTGKAVAPYGHEDFYRIPTNRGYYDLPTAIVLVKYINVPYRKASLSRKNILKRDDYACQYCGCELNEDTCTMDHVVPTSRGGRHTWENIAASCQRCNLRKADRTPQEAGMTLRKTPSVPTRRVLVFKLLERKNNSSWKRWLNV